MPKEARTKKAESAGAASAVSFVVWSETSPGLCTTAFSDGPPSADARRPLDERTAVFGEAVIRLSKQVPRGVNFPENNRLVDQLVGCATSVGANYCEAEDAVSGRDYKSKIGICRKESREAMFFLRMIAASQPELASDARTLWREAKELNLIFGSIWRKR